MKKKITAALLAVMLLCGGCGAEDPYRVDTVVRIPVNPTEAPTDAPPTEVPTEATEELTEAPTGDVPETAAATEAAKKQSSGGKKSTSGKTGSSGKNNKKETEPAATESPVTELPETEPDATQLSETEAPATEPPETEAPAMGPSVTEPPETQPSVTEPGETEAAATETPTEAPEETEPVLYDISGYALGSLEYAMEAEINAARSGEGLSELGLNGRLSAIASCRAYEISQVWSHTRPDGRGYATVLGDYGYGAGAVTELLVYVTGDGDAASIVAKWLQSDSHRGNLLGSWSAMGIGVYRANGYTYVCCLMVG